MQSTISRAVDPSRARAGKENIGLDRVDSQRPDRWQTPIGADALPPRAPIVAHEQARIATCDNGVRIFGMGDQRLYAAIEPERGAMPYPRLSGIWTVPHAPARCSKTYTVVAAICCLSSSRPCVIPQAGNIVLCLILAQQTDLVLGAGAAAGARADHRGLPRRHALSANR